jgi:hypothetical protein
MDQSERPRFYEGQYLGADDLSAGLDYGRVQSARHALGAHTWGIAIGLDLVERTLPSGDVDVSIMPGLAWDGYARPVVVLAPAKLTADQFSNFQAVTPPEGQLVKVWLRYDETAIRAPALGFETCRTDDQHGRIVESFAIYLGEPSGGPHGTLSVASRSVDALNARSAFNPGAAKVYDESVPYQEFPGGKVPAWLIPIGYVRWQKLATQPGRLLLRNDTGTTPDSDLIRSFRRYLGVIAETINAADGVIRLRDRWSDPDKTPFRAPRVVDKSMNDLVWIEGHLRVLGDTHIAGGRIDFHDETGGTDQTPLALRRVEPNERGGTDLQAVIGGDGSPTGKHALAIGPVKLDATTGALGNMDKKLVVRDDGKVGIGTTTPAAPLDVAGRILRQGKDFSQVGVAHHNDIVTANWGGNDDWNIFVSPRGVGREEPGSEFDNALLRLECFADPVPPNSWRITVRYKYKFSDADGKGEGTWYDDGQANYLLVPR